MSLRNPRRIADRFGGDYAYDGTKVYTVCNASKFTEIIFERHHKKGALWLSLE